MNADNNSKIKSAKESADVFLNNEEIPIDKMEEQICKTIIGQDEAIRKILNSIYTVRDYIGLNKPFVNLLIGQSGCGKTETIKQVCNCMDIPSAMVSITQFTQEGYQGLDVDQMLLALIADASKKSESYNISLAEHGVLFIDEIGKKASKETSDRDVSGLEVLNSLLPILNGDIVNVKQPQGRLPIAFDCSHLTIFLADAFEGLEKIREKRLTTKKAIGFEAPSPSSNAKLSPSQSSYNKDDLKEYGFPREFIGRINKIIVMNDMTPEILKSIIRDSKSSLFNIYTNNFKELYNLDLSYDFDIFEEIAQSVQDFGTGARELDYMLMYVFEEISYELHKLGDNRFFYKACVLYPGITEDNSKFKLIPAE